MAKRLHDTEIWEEDWFIALPDLHKLFWFFIKDRCDKGGVWRVNKLPFEQKQKQSIDINLFLNTVNTDKQRIEVISNNKWLIKGFFAFQYGDKLNPKAPVQRGAVESLLASGVTERQLIGLINLSEFSFSDFNVKSGKSNTVKDEKGIDRVSNVEEKKEDIKNINNDVIYSENKEYGFKSLNNNNLNTSTLSIGYQYPIDRVVNENDNDNDNSNRVLTENNKKQIFENFSLEEKKVQLNYSTPRFPMPEIIFCYDDSPLSKEIEKFLTGNFSHFGIIYKLTPAMMKTAIEEFIRQLQSSQQFETANKMMIHLTNWYRKKNENANNYTNNSKPEIFSTTKRDYSNVDGWRRKNQ